MQSHDISLLKFADSKQAYNHPIHIPLSPIGVATLARGCTGCACTHSAKRKMLGL